MSLIKMDLDFVPIATYLMTRRQKKINKKHVRLLGGERVRVVTNVYSIKMLEKPKEVCEF